MELLRKFYMADPGDVGGGTRDANQQAKELIETVVILKDSFISLGQAIARDIVGNLREANEETQDLGKLLSNEIKSGLKSWSKDSQLIVDNARKLSEGLLKSSDVQKQLNESAKRYSNFLTNIEISLRNEVISEAQALNYALKLEEVYSAQNQQLAQQALEAARIESSMGNLGKIFKGLAKIPIVGQLIDAEKVTKRMQQAAADGAGKWGTFGAGIKATFASIGESLTDPATIIAGLYTGLSKLVKLATEYQSKQFEAAKDLGVSVERGKQLRDSFVDLARTNLDLAVTADQLQKSYGGVQNELGIIVKQSDEFNLTTALIERRTGASAENMAQLQFAAKGMNTSLAKAYASIVGSAKAEGARVGVVQSEKQILEGISQTSGTIYQNFQGNFKAIAAANTQAKALGTSLDKINATQDQFLDFESSIAKQFEAEVLTGKELDLTRARQLALNHDTKGLMVEINKLVSSSAEWNKLDTITQQSKAEALGMSRDAVNQMFMDQQKTTLLGKDATADIQSQVIALKKRGVSEVEIEQTLGQQAVLSAKQASASEKIAATMDSVQQSIGQMTQALMPFIQAFADFVGDADRLKGIFVVIGSLIAGMAAFSIALKMAEQQILRTELQKLTVIAAINKLIAEQIEVETVLIEEKEAEAVASVTSGAGYLGPAAIGVGVATGAALVGITGIALSGGTTSAPPTGITPYNAGAASTSNSSTSTGTGAEGNSQPIVITVNTDIDGATVARKVVHHTPAVYGKNAN
jgi:hypothetical protein